MPQIRYQGSLVTIQQPDSVLDALENAGHKIPYSCRAGLCHSCMMQSAVAPPLSAQQGLSSNQKAQHFFLACSCYPEQDMDVNRIGDSDQIQGTVKSKSMLNATVLKLLIEVDCRWFPGQYLNVWKDDIQSRSYSIASRCDDKKRIELHVKRHDQGLLSCWLHDEVVVGQTLRLSKPIGNCFYTDDKQGSSLLLVATGTGLAPLYGVLQEALHQGHNDPIYLYAAAGDIDGLYYREDLMALAQQYPNFYYCPVVRRQESRTIDADLVEADVVSWVQQQHPSLKGWKVFLCGNSEMIKQLQRFCFFQGVPVDDILVDAFIIKKPIDASV